LMTDKEDYSTGSPLALYWGYEQSSYHDLYEYRHDTRRIYSCAMG
jgi:hypothetical protein